MSVLNLVSDFVKCNRPIALYCWITKITLAKAKLSLNLEALVRIGCWIPRNQRLCVICYSCWSLFLWINVLFNCLGSAGSVVAARLAEAGHTVLLVEAGGSAHFLQSVPLLALSFWTGPYDWNYKVKLRKGIGGVYKDNVMNYPRGKELGGSSMLNLMIYMRGHSHDYNEWLR
jgi:hypothetical protein